MIDFREETNRILVIAHTIDLGAEGSVDKLLNTSMRQRGNRKGMEKMAKNDTKVTVETLTHDGATRKNIPTAEYQ